MSAQLQLYIIMF